MATRTTLLDTLPVTTRARPKTLENPDEAGNVMTLKSDDNLNPEPTRPIVKVASGETQRQSDAEQRNPHDGSICCDGLGTMPKRMIRDWTDSERVNTLTAHAERFFVRLIMKADDFGRFHAHPKLLRSFLFPLLTDKVREADVARWVAECETAGLIVRYTADGKPLLEIVNFGQRLDRATAKFPDRPAVSGNPPEVPGSSRKFPAEVEREKEPEVEVEVEKEFASARASKSAYSDEFEQWWSVYPRKESKADAWKAWPKAVAVVMQFRDMAAPQASEWLVAITKVFRDSEKGRSQYVPHGATWLNGKRWEDDVAAWDRRDSKVQDDPRGNFAALAEYRQMKAAAAVGIAK